MSQNEHSVISPISETRYNVAFCLQGRGKTLCNTEKCFIENKTKVMKENWRVFKCRHAYNKGNLGSRQAQPLAGLQNNKAEY